MESNKPIIDTDFQQINQLYDECLNYLQKLNESPKLNLFYIEDHKNIDYEDQYDPDCYTVKDDIFVNNNDIHFKGSIDDEYIKNTKATIVKNESNIINNKTNYKAKDSTEIGTSKSNIEADLQTYNRENEVEYKDKDNQFKGYKSPNLQYKIENELLSNESIHSLQLEPKSERLRKLSQQLPRIVITQSNSSLNVRKEKEIDLKKLGFDDQKPVSVKHISRSSLRYTKGYANVYPKRLVTKRGFENVALISNVPFEKIRLLNDTFHTLINLRWRWIIIGTIVVHFAIWLVFAVFWYLAALAHYDFEPNPPNRTCVTGGKDFVTIFLASVEAQTTIGFGDRAIDEECPESIFLFIMQLILGTGLSGVLTCVVYAKLTRPEKLSKDGVGFSKRAVISMRDGCLCLMMRAWDLNYDHIINSEFTAHFVNTHRTKEGEVIRYYARSLQLQQRQFLLWPVTLVHVIDDVSPFYGLTPHQVANHSYEITLSLKGASASMGTFTQSQTSYVPKEILWGHRFLSVVKYDNRKRKYFIEDKKLDSTEPVETPFCSAKELYSTIENKEERPETPNSFSDQIAGFTLNRTSSFR